MDTNIKAYWLGHSAFKFITPKKEIIYVDPFLKDNPSTPDNLKEISKAHYILLSHGHEDHVGDTIEIAEKTGCKVVANVELCGILKRLGLAEDQAIEFNKGGTVAFDEFSVTLVSANHSSAYEGEYAGEAGGLVVSFEDEICIYHMGDTNIFADLELYGDLYEPHVVLAPIGDKYTMGHEEAAYAVEMVGAKLAVPMHYGTWPPLTGDPEAFKERLEDISETEVVIPEPGVNFLDEDALG